MKLLKKALITIFLFLSFASLVLWVIAKNTNPETIKNLVNNQLSAITNKKSAIHGSLSWHLFPMPGIKITEISLGNSDKQEDYYLSAHNLLLNLKIAPLLRGHLVFNNINLDGVSMIINTDVNKSTSILQKNSNFEPVNEKTNTMQLHIERFLLSHGQIHINNQGKTLHIKNLKLGVEQFNLHNTAFPVQLKASLSSQVNKNTLRAQLNYNGHVSLSSKSTNNPFIEGQIQIKNVQLNALMIDTINANIKSNAKSMRFSPLTINLYNGESIGDVYYDFNTKKITINQTATNLDGQTFMTDLVGKESMQGNLDYSIQAEIPLNKLNIDNILGKGSITLKDGILNKINLGLLIDDMKNTLSSQIKTNTFLIKSDQFDMTKYNQGNTPFKLINIQYQLQHAQLITESFILQTDSLQMKGKGNFNLNNQNIQSNLQVIVANNTEESLLNIQKILGGGFPILLKGTLEKPILLPDLTIMNDALNSSSLLKEAVRKTLKPHKLASAPH